MADYKIVERAKLEDDTKESISSWFYSNKISWIAASRDDKGRQWNKVEAQTTSYSR